MPSDTLSPTELRNLLVTMLAGAAGGTEDDWYDRVGLVEVLPIWKHPRCNWRVEFEGTADERHAFDRAVEILLEVHPYVRG